MNDAHLHIVVNHFPIIGTIFGIGILVTGLLLKNNSVKNTAYVLFIVAAIFGAFSIATGEGAEKIVEDFPNIGKAIIHEHEELAEKLALVLYVMGGFSLFALFLSFKKNSKEKLVSFFILGLGIASLFLIQKAGTSGGEIRHTEIRDDSTVSASSNENSSVQKESKEDNE
ncbi:hypothetical protein ACFX5E_06855 [Flavobacterium sp. LS2P90]|uniref:DUF2178 domain-containing protein n=1 Tax=Flavobacterium xylosi TaxID=3230415 RepID=A0ABW6HWL4_9FLAO